MHNGVRNRCQLPRRTWSFHFGGLLIICTISWTWPFLNLAIIESSSLQRDKNVSSYITSASSTQGTHFSGWKTTRLPSDETLGMATFILRGPREPSTLEA